VVNVGVAQSARPWAATVVWSGGDEEQRLARSASQ
jgi:hypothetical protein